MKKVLLASSLVLALTLATSANAGLWEKASTFLDRVVNPTANYNVEASGWNIRVVEWIPEGNKNIRCVFAGGSKKGGVACYPIGAK